MVRPTYHLLPLLLLLIICITSSSMAEDVEIDAASGEPVPVSRPEPIHAIFINSLADKTVNLYWAGNVNSPTERSLQLYYGPLDPGGQRAIDGFEGQIFVLTHVGSYERLGEYRLGLGSAAVTSIHNSRETFILTEDSVSEFGGSRLPTQGLASMRREENAKKCRTLSKKSSNESFMHRCQSCVSEERCGFSLVRDASNYCVSSHAVATINTVEGCHVLNSVKEETSPSDIMSAEAWLNKAAELALAQGDNITAYGSLNIKMAYGYSEKSVERAEQMMVDARDKKDDTLIKAAETMVKKAKAALAEMKTKLEAVFDDMDAKELLESSRHPKLAEIHQDMPMVPRRTAEDAIPFILQGEPVVITDLFDNGIFNPVAHRWTLNYLQKVFSATTEEGGTPPKFNVAADLSTRCCRYFEAQGKAKSLGYPYPFAPTTHLYRDTFDGFVKTIRKANRDRIGSANNSTKPKLLHYLHEIVMNRDGKTVVAGGPAPQQLADDLDTITSQLRPLAAKQPFFDNFAAAKVWLGMQGIVMPLHYDATDNLYVMAWGRKRAIIGQPGQLDALYRYPNGHPLVGSSQVNLTDPDLERYPHFKDAKLAEVIVGPGDVLYLPAWWWHQFEQPFEDTAALNLWSKDRDQAPSAQMRDVDVREHVLADHLEESVTRKSGKDAGIILDAVANGKSSPYYAALGEHKYNLEKKAMLSAANSWRHEMSQLPGADPKEGQSADALVEQHLDRTHRNVMQEVDSKGWQPGVSWDLSQTAKLPRVLRDRCESAPELSPFMSICG